MNIVLLINILFLDVNLFYVVMKVIEYWVFLGKIGCIVVVLFYYKEEN